MIPHSGSNNEVRAATRLFVHYISTRGDRRQRHSSECIHNKIYPQHLSNGKRQFASEEGSKQNAEQSHHINGKLEYNETLDVLIQRTSPHNSRSDAIK